MTPSRRARRSNASSCRHRVHGLVQRRAHRCQPAANALVVGVHHLQRLHLQHRSCEQMTHVVVYLAGDAAALGQGGQAHLVVLRGHELAVLVRKRQRRLLLLVAQGAVALALLARAFRAPRHEAGSRAQHGRGDEQNVLGAQRGRQRHDPGQPHEPEPLAEQHVRDDRQQRGELRDEQRRQLVRARRREAKPRMRVHVEAARHHDGAQERRDMRAGERRERQKQQAQRNEDDFVDNPIHGHQYSGRQGAARHEDATK